MIASLILSVALGAFAVAAYSDDPSIIGLTESIYVPEKDLLGAIPNGVHIFNEIPPKCILQKNDSTSVRHDEYFSNTATFYSSIGTSTGLKGTYEADFTLGVTLDATTKSISAGERTVSGNSLKMATKPFTKFVDLDCINAGVLTPGVLAAFDKLEDVVQKPWLTESWRSYKTFLQKYGSHLVVEVVFGSSIDQYAFAKSEKKYTAREFTVKSCVSLAGSTGVEKLNVSLCANISKEEVHNVTSYEMSSSITVRGGTPTTRSEVLDQRNHTLIKKFMNEGDTNPAPIGFKLKPIWELLQERVNTTKDMAKSVNMEYYYKGYLNFGCPYRTKNGQELQKFEMTPDSTAERPEYRCSIAPEGCHSYDDCHYHNVKCECRGDSCIRYSTVTSDTGKTKQVANPSYSSSWYGHGCGWKVWGSVCQCSSERKERTVIWGLESKRALYRAIARYQCAAHKGAGGGLPIIPPEKGGEGGSEGENEIYKPDKGGVLPEIIVGKGGKGVKGGKGGSEEENRINRTKWQLKKKKGGNSVGF